MLRCCWSLACRPHGLSTLLDSFTDGGLDTTSGTKHRTAALLLVEVLAPSCAPGLRAAYCSATDIGAHVMLDSAAQHHSTPVGGGSGAPLPAGG